MCPLRALLTIILQIFQTLRNVFLTVPEVGNCFVSSDTVYIYYILKGLSKLLAVWPKGQGYEGRPLIAIYFTRIATGIATVSPHTYVPRVVHSKYKL